MESEEAKVNAEVEEVMEVKDKINKEEEQKAEANKAEEIQGEEMADRRGWWWRRKRVKLKIEQSIW